MRIVSLCSLFLLLLMPKVLAAAKAEEAAWDVSLVRGPARTIQITTDKGTWMNVDVRPDGEEIVFDLLGDLYTLPIDGGTAQAITEGIAWDMQARYSPDGRSIAFTSDRGGGDNIWVIDDVGATPRAVTNEEFRLLNSPVWTPDGRFIAARKHYTRYRSLGAGEIWLYHRSGGKGVQLTKRVSHQKDLGEPAFSPDGRYLYYSRDASPGENFEYGKDPNSGIYAIERLDRRDGSIENFIHGTGGAVRPTPSPDGEWLAFVRRVRGKSVLYVHHVQSGEERALYDGLDRDLQETWAIHGVYPTMAWLPDSRSIVFWAGGRIHRAYLDDGRHHEIPFQVRSTRQIMHAVRHQVDVAPDRFHTKMLRWVQVSPDGKQVIYQALGKLYVQTLPEGEARRLTTDEDGFEFYPSFSRDGAWIVYTTWNDDSFGTVRVIPSDGGKGRTLDTKPGHFVEPVFSPDGQKVLYRRVGGGTLRSPRWSHDQGLYIVPVSGGDPRRIHKSGTRAHFGADPDRVFVLVTQGPEERSLASIDLMGGNLRTHVTSKRASDIRVSPDGRWLAFNEEYHVYLTPFVATGRTYKIGPKQKGLPLAQLSKFSGDNIHWSGDSHTLHWSLGPQLFSRSLKEAFSFLSDGGTNEPRPVEHGQKIGFVAKADVPDGALAFVGARIITMHGNEVFNDGTLVLRGNRIMQVGEHRSVTIPKDAKVLDLSGLTILPGMIDVHAHGPHAPHSLNPQTNWVDYATLAFGVTTIHDPSHGNAAIFSSAELAQAGLTVSPRIFSTGTILYGANAWFRAKVDSLDDAVRHVARQKLLGAIAVKSYNQPRRDQRQQVLEAARKLKMMVVAEGGALLQHNLTMVVDGHTGVEHALPVANVYDDVIQLWSGSRTGYTPTLNVAYGGLGGEHFWYAEQDVWAHERLSAFVPQKFLDPNARRRLKVPDEDWNHRDVARGAAQMAVNGAMVQLGAHGQREGLGAHWELWSLADGGMSNLEALRCATLNGAVYLGLDRDLGSIERGKLADLMIVEGNPLDNIRLSEKVRYTVLNGRLYDAATMNELGNHPRARPKFFWEAAMPSNTHVK